MKGVLGEKVAAPKRYSPDILEAIPRAAARAQLGTVSGASEGVDVWHLYELSWLAASGMPQARVGALVIPADSPATVESKSLKLYLNSLNFHAFDSEGDAKACIEADVGKICGASVTLHTEEPEGASLWTRPVRGQCIDAATPDPDVAAVSVDSSARKVSETLHSHQLRSLCPVTGQPDWATLEVEYTGLPINHSQLLTYLLSFREHQDFHEQCVEQIYSKLLRDCEPDALRVSAFYLRRGGIDITPHRGALTAAVPLDRLARQ